MERSQGTLQIFNVVAYWHSLQSIHSPITYCQPPCVFSVYRYCTRKGVRKSKGSVPYVVLLPLYICGSLKTISLVKFNLNQHLRSPHGYLIQINYFLNQMFLYTNLHITLNIDNIFPILKQHICAARTQESSVISYWTNSILLCKFQIWILDLYCVASSTCWLSQG